MTLETLSAASGAHFASSDPGFEALPLAHVVATHRPLLDRIKLCFGADRATFERELMPLVHGYASFVHLLPATSDNYFHTPGGLLQLGLETAFYSLQGTDAHIFSGRATISERRELEPRWRIATFIGGLCCELHRALSHLIVTTAGGGGARGHPGQAAEPAVLRLGVRRADHQGALSHHRPGRR